MLFLLETEDAYIEFIKRNQKVELKKIDLQASPETYSTCLTTARNLQLKDRFLFDKANRAFVSYIQSYNKHECSLILRLKDLDLGEVAMGFALLKMPRMPETKGRDITAFQEYDFDFNLIPYKDKQREQNRLTKLSSYRETGVWASKGKRHMKKTEPWSETKKRKTDRQEKRGNKKEKKKKKIEEGSIKKRKRKRVVTQEEVAELAQDIALMKKLKKKKVSDKFYSAKNISQNFLEILIFLFTSEIFRSFK